MDRILELLLYLSDAIVPILIFVIVGCGIIARIQVYDVFVKGAREGFLTVIKIMPTLIGLMVAVGVLRASGFLDLVAGVFSGLTDWIHFPSELVPLTVIRLFSSSAATGLALDIFKEFGTDSKIGLLASLMMSSTETVFYTMSVYFMTAKVRKTRFTLAGALFATAAGIVASIVLAGML